GGPGGPDCRVRRPRKQRLCRKFVQSRRLGRGRRGGRPARGDVPGHQPYRRLRAGARAGVSRVDPAEDRLRRTAVRGGERRVERRAQRRGPAARPRLAPEAALRRAGDRDGRQRHAQRPARRRAALQHPGDHRHRARRQAQRAHRARGDAGRAQPGSHLRRSLQPRVSRLGRGERGSARSLPAGGRGDGARPEHRRRHPPQRAGAPHPRRDGVEGAGAGAARGRHGAG
ncbi:MAG: Arylesterase precursor, partial [uncultured Gemmatimonadetes bacterium]